MNQDAEFGKPTFCKILPELPKPEKLRRQIRKDGGYDMVPAYSPEEMYQYGELCVSEAIAALQAEPVPMTDAQAEHGWLIECNIATSAPYWLTADNTNTNDANEALRFARKIDAEGFLKVFLTAHFGDDTFGIYKRHFSPEKYSVTEHMFIGIKPKGE